jgi:hypothetical protein
MVEDDSVLDENGEVAETGYLNEKGEMVRPWCAATRILEHRETERLNQEAEERKKAEASRKDDSAGPSKPPRREDFPEIVVGGGWRRAVRAGAGKGLQRGCSCGDA